MEKRNVVEDRRTPCRKIKGEEFCDCPNCVRTVRKQAAVRTDDIQDVQRLSEKQS